MKSISLFKMKVLLPFILNFSFCHLTIAQVNKLNLKSPLKQRFESEIQQIIQKTKKKMTFSSRITYHEKVDQFLNKSYVTQKNINKMVSKFPMNMALNYVEKIEINITLLEPVIVSEKVKLITQIKERFYAKGSEKVIVLLKDGPKMPVLLKKQAPTKKESVVNQAKKEENPPQTQQPSVLTISPQKPDKVLKDSHKLWGINFQYISTNLIIAVGLMMLTIAFIFTILNNLRFNKNELSKQIVPVKPMSSNTYKSKYVDKIEELIPTVEKCNSENPLEASSEPESPKTALLKDFPVNKLISYIKSRPRSSATSSQISNRFRDIDANKRTEVLRLLVEKKVIRTFREPTRGRFSRIYTIIHRDD